MCGMCMHVRKCLCLCVFFFLLLLLFLANIYHQPSTIDENSFASYFLLFFIPFLLLYVYVWIGGENGKSVHPYLSALALCLSVSIFIFLSQSFDCLFSLLIIFFYFIFLLANCVVISLRKLGHFDCDFDFDFYFILSIRLRYLIFDASTACVYYV